MSSALWMLQRVRSSLKASPRALDDRRLSRSLVKGLVLLASFPADGQYIGNAEIAAIAGMGVTTAHRYVSTLVAAGLIWQDPSSRKYRLAL
jgi:Fic family protein